MLKHKLVITISSILTTAAVASGVGISFFYNQKNNQFHHYYKAPTSSSEADLIQTYFSSAVNGTRLLYLPSFVHQQPLINALSIKESQNKPVYDYLSKTGYLLMDSGYGLPNYNIETGKLMPGNQPIWSTNVGAVEFRADLGSFVTGIAIGQFLNENKDYFLQEADELTWATYGGDSYATVVCFMGGIQQGINWYNENVVPKQSGYLKIKHLQVGGSKSQNFVESFDPNGGTDLIDKILKLKPSVIIPVAGPQTQQVVRKITQNQQRTIVVGVDSAIENDLSVNLKLPKLKQNEVVGNNNIVQFSSVKNLGNMLDKITQKINAGEIEPTIGDIENEYVGGIGYNSLGTLFNNGVGVSGIGKEYFVKAMQLSKSTTQLDANIIKQIKLDNVDQLYNDELKTKEFKDIIDWLNLPENKVYKIDNTDPELLPSLSYSSISNNGFSMLSITSDDAIIDWVNKFTNLPTNEAKNQLINDLINWRQQNIDTIKKRSNVVKNLKNAFTKENYYEHKNIAKIIFQSQTSILFDNSFYQACYEGLVQYWKTQNVNLPLPHNSQK